MKFINKLKGVINSQKGKVLRSNFISLSSLQAANYILPLLTLPYLVRVLGVENFGVLAFVGAISVYLLIFTDFGFNLTATREISIHRDDKIKINEIVSSVLSIKLILLFTSFIVLLCLLFLPKFEAHRLAYIFSFLGVIGQSLFPVWFFQGVESMKYITYLNVSSKVIFTILIFLVIKEEGDYYLVPLLSAVGTILTCLISYKIIIKNYGVKFSFQAIETLKIYIVQSKKIFAGQISYSLIGPTLIFIVSTVSGNVAAGYYSSVEKIIRAISSLASPVSQTIYPYLSNAYSKGSEKTKRFSLIVTLIYSSFSLVLGFTIYLFGETFLLLFYGENMIKQDFIDLFKVMSIYPFLYGIVHIYCTQLLLISNNLLLYRRVLSVSLLFSVLSGFLLVNMFGTIGAAYSMISSEMLIILLTLGLLRKV